MDTHVADALERGAKLVAGGSRATGFRTDLYWQATVLTDVTEEMEVAREESFGPVVPITRISSDDEALRIANASPYGLLTAVWTKDLARGLRFAEAVDAGWVNINESTNYWESHLPFGRPSRLELGYRTCGRELGAGGVHRAEDGRRHAALMVRQH